VVSKKQKASDSSYAYKSHKKSPNEAAAGYMKVKEAKAHHPSNKTEALGVELKMFVHAQTKFEKLELLQKQISVVTKEIEQSKSKENASITVHH
jgi:hypothetical protein